MTKSPVVPFGSLGLGVSVLNPGVAGWRGGREEEQMSYGCLGKSPDSSYLFRLSVSVRSERAETTLLDIWHTENVNYVYVTITSFIIGVLCDRCIMCSKLFLIPRAALVWLLAPSYKSRLMLREAMWLPRARSLLSRYRPLGLAALRALWPLLAHRWVTSPSW